MAAPLPYSRVVDVEVTYQDQFPTTQGFQTALGLVSVSLPGLLDASHRTRVYGAIEELDADGWNPAGEPYKLVQRYFSRLYRPPQIKLAYRNPANDILTEIAAIRDADREWYWLFHTKELNDTAEQRRLADWCEAREIIFGADTNDPDTEVAANVSDASATVTITIASPAVISWAAHGLSAGQAVSFATTGALPTGIDAGTIYYVMAAGLTTNAFQIAATPTGAAINTSGTQSGVHTATARQFGGSFAEYVQGLKYNRTAAFYHTDPNAYLAASAFSYAAGRNLDRANYELAKRGIIDAGQAYTLKFKETPGVPAISKGSAAVQAITGFVPALGIDPAQGHGANTVVNIGGTEFLVEGNVASGRFIDAIHATDWLRARTQESILGVLRNNPRVPYTNEGVAFLISAGIQPVMRRAVAAGIVAQDIAEDGSRLPPFEIIAERVENVLAAQRANRIAPDIIVKFRYGGALHYVSVRMTVRF